MKISESSNTEIEETIKNLNGWKNPPDVLYIADSFGNLDSDKTETLINLTSSFWKGEIGFHAHNNLGLGFSNTLLAIESGVDYVDGSITGMGRGCGNMKLEQLLMYLDYDCSEIFGLINPPT